MSIFGALGKLTRAVVDTALLPVDVVVDVVTSPLIAMDERDSSIVRRAERIKQQLEEAHEETFEDD